MFQKLPETSMFNIGFLTANVIQLPSDAKITFSQGVATDLQKGICLLDYVTKTDKLKKTDVRY